MVPIVTSLNSGFDRIAWHRSLVLNQNADLTNNNTLCSVGSEGSVSLFQIVGVGWVGSVRQQLLQLSALRGGGRRSESRLPWHQRRGRE